MNEPIGQIPKQWRTKVATILREGRTDRVFIRQRARRDWAALTSCPFENVLRETLAEALSIEGLKGKKYEMDEPGETYGFIFHYSGFTLYAKINLTSPEEIVIVYSAHAPLHGEELR